MTESASKVVELALAWLVSRSEGKGSEVELARALDGFGKHLPDWKTRVEAATTAMIAGELARREGKSLRLTAAGRALALAALGVDALPKADWKKLKNEYLVPRMLGVPARRKRGKSTKPGEALIAAILARHEGLTGAGEAPTLAAVQNALVWKTLGDESNRPISREAILALILGRLIGATRTPKSKDALRLLAAKHVGARRAGVEEMRTAIVRRWLEGAAEPPRVEAAVQLPAVRPDVARPFDDLASFARRVVETARTAKTGRFGDNKVFISHVHRQIGDGLELDAFKVRLIEAQRARFLTLSRADLVEAMNPEDVRASETRYLGEEFHFVRLDEEKNRW